MILESIAVGAALIQLTTGALIAMTLFKKSPAQSEKLPRISIVVPARDEAVNLPKLFGSLRKLNYDADKLEIIVVNDDSKDETKKIAETLGQSFPFKVRVIDAVHDEGESLPATKTLPLAQGIDVANGELILMTDGDCEVNENWALDIVRHFEPEVGMVCGITLPDYERTQDKVTRFETVDWSLLLGVCAGMCRIGRPLALIGNNYAIRKSCYSEIGTFRSIAHNHIDDIALFRAVADASEWKIAFAVTPGACVKTIPVGVMKAIVKQRYRWMVGFDAVSYFGKLLFGFGMITHLLWPMTLFLDAPIGLLTTLGILLGDWLVIGSCLAKLRKPKLLPYALLYPLYSLQYGWQLLYSLVRRPEIRWKERRLA